jgi:hypothetical protein
LARRVTNASRVCDEIVGAACGALNRVACDAIRDAGTAARGAPVGAIPGSLAG